MRRDLDRPAGNGEEGRGQRPGCLGIWETDQVRTRVDPGEPGSEQERGLCTETGVGSGPGQSVRVGLGEQAGGGGGGVGGGRGGRLGEG